jgi:MPBQ/MSBQ methyltransferase
LQAGPSPLQLGSKVEDKSKKLTNPILFLLRLLLGSVAGFYFVLVPAYMWIKDKIWPRNLGGF